MARIACLLIPDLPTAAALRAEPEASRRPLAIATGPGGQASLLSVSPEARAHGIRRGHTVTQARTLCEQVSVRIASPAREASARASLLDLAFSFSPHARLVAKRAGLWAAETGVLLDASGMGQIFRTEQAFATALVQRARTLGLEGRVAIANSQTLAEIAARTLSTTRSHDSLVLPPGSERAFLAPLPIDLLDPDDDLAAALTRFGIRTLRDLSNLPRRSLSNRLGPRILPLLETAEGGGPDSPLPAANETRFSEAHDLEFPIDRTDSLLFVLQGLLSRLIERLKIRHLACRSLRLELTLSDGSRDARHVGVAAATRDLRVLLRLLRHGLEDRAPEASVEGISVETEGIELRSDQLDLFRPAGPTPTQLGEVLAELSSICGNEHVGAPEVANSHHPDALAIQGFPPKHQAQTTDAIATQPSLFSPLALRVLRPPLTAQVQLAGLEPSQVRSALANGGVIRCAGPWRTTGGWWSREGRFAFDHYDVLTSDGTVARLRFDHVARSWQIDALYD